MFPNSLLYNNSFYNLYFCEKIQQLSNEDEKGEDKKTTTVHRKSRAKVGRSSNALYHRPQESAPASCLAGCKSYKSSSIVSQ